MFRRRQRDLSLVLRMQRRRHLPDPKFTPPFQNPRVPGLVKLSLAKRLLCFLPTGPQITPESGHLSGTGTVGRGCMLLDHGIEEDEGGEETWVHERKVY